MEILVRPDDVTKEEWKAVMLPNEPTVHRMHWVKAGKDEFRLLVQALHGRGNRGGKGENGAKLLAYEVPENVAAFYAEDGWLAINGGEANVGREALAGVAESFMSAFPDMVLEFDGLEFVNGRVNYHWTFIGTNTGPDGTGNAVHFSGFESWVFDDDGLIAESLGNFDQAEYEHHLAHGVDAE